MSTKALRLASLLPTILLATAINAGELSVTGMTPAPAPSPFPWAAQPIDLPDPAAEAEATPREIPSGLPGGGALVWPDPVSQHDPGDSGGLEPISPNGIDSDADGVPDEVDNCLLAYNPDQYDSNTDGLGNACDQDLNNDCFVDFQDVALFKPLMFTADLDSDFLVDGQVDFFDMAIMKDALFKPAGPSLAIHLCSVAAD